MKLIAVILRQTKCIPIKSDVEESAETVELFWRDHSFTRSRRKTEMQ